MSTTRTFKMERLEDRIAPGSCHCSCGGGHSNHGNSNHSNRSHRSNHSNKSNRSHHSNHSSRGHGCH